MWLLLPGDIESNPGPVNPTESNRKRKQNKSFPSFCKEYKTAKANSKRLMHPFQQSGSPEIFRH